MSFVTLSLYVHSAPCAEGQEPNSACEDERVIFSPDGERVLIGVLDGCGGTGARRYPEAGNWSGARIASHVAGRSLFRWFAGLSQERFHNGTAPELAEELEAQLGTAIRDANALLESGSAPRFVSSRLSKALPTTLAAITAEKLPDDHARLCSFWAGNSRNYVFLCTGLRQLSADDVVGNYDPFEDLAKDGILSNSVNASAPFEIHVSEMPVKGPCLILSASDGVFSYFDSPIRLEWLLLDTLRQAETPAQWELLLRKEIGAVSADDHTLQLAALGFESFPELKGAFLPRLEELEREYILPLQAAVEEEDQERLLLLWQKYRETFLTVKREEEAEHG